MRINGRVTHMDPHALVRATMPLPEGEHLFNRAHCPFRVVDDEGNQYPTQWERVIRHADDSVAVAELLSIIPNPNLEGGDGSFRLRVVERQSDANCAGGAPAEIVGFVCFEVREVSTVPGKVIRGRFLCDSDPLISECDVGGSGGLDFGLRASSPVLVE